jgi:ankyrin repeat protein
MILMATLLPAKQCIQIFHLKLILSGPSFRSPLSQAVLKGNLSMVKLLLGKGAKLDDAALFHRKNDVNIQIIKYLLKRGANPKATDASGNTLLHKQCKSGNLKNVKYLIEHCNADVSAKNRQGHTPLHLACTGNTSRYIFIDKSLHFLKIVKYLIEEENADPVVNCDKGKSALHYAAENNYSPSILRYLIQHQKLDIEATDNKGRTALHLACQTGILFEKRWETQKYLIEEHAKIIELKDKTGKTSLYYCLENFTEKENYKFDNFRPIALILATKAKILKTQENKDTEHIFDWIKQSYDNDMKKSKGEDETISCLIAGLNMFQKQFDKKDTNYFELNPLLYIVSYCNRVDIAKFMFYEDLCYIEKHVKAEEAKSKRILLFKSYLEFSCENGLLDFTRILFQEICNSQEFFEHLHFDGCFLKTACRSKHFNIFKNMLEDEKAKDEAAEFLKDFPLHYACARGSLEMVQYLIKTKKIDIEVKDKVGRTPLHLACINKGSIEIVRYLIEKQNANTNTTDNKGRSVFHSACQSRCFELVKYISQKTELDVNDQDEDGSTALHVACEQYSLKVVKFLITDLKADLHLLNKEGRTPLHVCGPKVSIVKFLVNKGTKVLTKDKSMKFLQIAKRKLIDEVELITFLKAATKQ